MNRDISEVNDIYRAYFDAHTPMRCAVGADLQVGMLIEAIFRVEVPEVSQDQR